MQLLLQANSEIPQMMEEPESLAPGLIGSTWPSIRHVQIHAGPLSTLGVTAGAVS